MRVQTLQEKCFKNLGWPTANVGLSMVIFFLLFSHHVPKKPVELIQPLVHLMVQPPVSSEQSVMESTEQQQVQPEVEKLPELQEEPKVEGMTEQPTIEEAQADPKDESLDQSGSEMQPTPKESTEPIAESAVEPMAESSVEEVAEKSVAETPDGETTAEPSSVENSGIPDQTEDLVKKESCRKESFGKS